MPKIPASNVAGSMMSDNYRQGANKRVGAFVYRRIEHMMKRLRRLQFGFKDMAPPPLGGLRAFVKSHCDGSAHTFRLSEEADQPYSWFPKVFCIDNICLNL